MAMYGGTAILLRMIDEAFDRKTWHGTNLRGAIRGLTLSEVAWRPEARRHDILEIVVHADHWKYTVRRRRLGETRGPFRCTDQIGLNVP
jgi:hypothetical protein